jgi:hypothetical protein
MGDMEVRDASGLSFGLSKVEYQRGPAGVQPWNLERNIKSRTKYSKMSWLASADTSMLGPEESKNGQFERYNPNLRLM